MKKSIFLVRHAEARPAQPNEKDLDRPLTSKGIQDASRIGAWIYQQNIDISAIICSNAARTLQTANLIVDQIKIGNDRIKKHEDLFEASVRLYFSIISEWKDSWDKVMIIGHNPVLSYFLEYVTRQESGFLSPGSMAIIEQEIENWNEFSEGSASLSKIIFPETINLTGV